MDATLNVLPVGDGITVIELHGALLRNCDQAIVAAFNQASGPRAHTIVLNLEGLESVSSGGLCSLAALLARANHRGQRVLACGPNDHIRDVFRSARLTEVLPTFDDMAHALEAITRGNRRSRVPTSMRRTRRVQPRPAVRTRSRDYRSFWATRVSVLRVARVPDGAVHTTVHGRRVNGPMQGFGKMWRKSYRIGLDERQLAPAEVMAAWKTHFPAFWPAGNRFFKPLTGFTPGEIALISLDLPGPVELESGVLVLYADDESFTLMTPQGHSLAGWITFSAIREQDQTIAQAEVLMRASDPFYEIGMTLFGHRQEDAFWAHTLRSLAAHFGTGGDIETHAECVDPRWQWKHAANLWHNAAIHSAIRTVRLPLRWSARRRDLPDAPLASEDRG